MATPCHEPPAVSSSVRGRSRPQAALLHVAAPAGQPPESGGWHEILEVAYIVVEHRPGWRAPDVGPLGELISAHGTHLFADLHEAAHGRIYIHAVTQLEIASTEIRHLVSAGRDPRFLMPDAVRKVIEESGIYMSEMNE